MRDAQALTNIEGLTPLGESVELVYLRQGNEEKVRLTTAIPLNRHVPGGQLHPKLRGTVLDRVSERARISGVIIESIESDSLAAEAGLREGDIITAVNRVRFHEMKQLRELFEDIEDRRNLLLQIQRGRRSYLAVLE